MEVVTGALNLLTLTIDVTCTTTLQTREEKYKNHPLSSVIFKRICIESRISSYFTSQQLPFRYESRLVYYENNKSSLHQRATTTQTHQAFRFSFAFHGLLGLGPKKLLDRRPPGLLGLPPPPPPPPGRCWLTGAGPIGTY